MSGRPSPWQRISLTSRVSASSFGSHVAPGRGRRPTVSVHEDTLMKEPLVTMNRRDWMKLTVGGGAGLALGQFVNIGEVQAKVKNLKLAGVKEFTTACNFCSCGCGMVC